MSRSSNPAGHLCRGERTDPAAERPAGAAWRDPERLDCLPRALERDEGGGGCGLRVEKPLGRGDREGQRLERPRDRQLAIERERAEIEEQPHVALREREAPPPEHREHLGGERVHRLEAEDLAVSRGALEPAALDRRGCRRDRDGDEHVGRLGQDRLSVRRVTKADTAAVGRRRGQQEVERPCAVAGQEVELGGAEPIHVPTRHDCEDVGGGASSGRRRDTSGTITAPMRHTFVDSVASGHRGCPWGWLSWRARRGGNVPGG